MRINNIHRPQKKIPSVKAFYPIDLVRKGNLVLGDGVMGNKRKEELKSLCSNAMEKLVSGVCVCLCEREGGRG